jgi:hypothetical protein
MLTIACPSVNKLRFTPLLARSVGLDPPGIFTTQRGLAHRPIHAQPGPIYLFQFIKLLYPFLPQFEEHSGLNPLPVAVVPCRTGTQVGLVERFPLATGSQDVKNAVGTFSIRDTRASTPESVRIHVNRQQRLQDIP